jgi:hypothetical protein
MMHMTKSTRTASDSELAHQRALLQTHTQHLQTIERQIATFGPALVPVHLLAQRDWFEAERTKALRRIKSIERQQTPRSAQSVPQARALLLNGTLPTGLLHLLNKNDFPLVAVELINPTRREVVFIVTSWIEARSFTSTDRVSVPPGATVTIHQLPTLQPEAIANSYEFSKGVLQTRVSTLQHGNEALLLLQSLEVSFLARDVLLWGTFKADGSVQDRSALVGAWVTPNERSIVGLLREAVVYAPGKQLVGYQGSGTPAQRAAIVRDQVRAIFEALKSHASITYINSPLNIGPSNKDIRQRISLPRDSINFRQANCIDGAVLYASLIERAAMNAAVVIIPGHAFVGWETWRGSGTYEFLETTMTADHSFEAAWKRGQEQYAAKAHLLGQPLFDRGGFTRLLRLPDLRQAGILPME